MAEPGPSAPRREVVQTTVTVVVAALVALRIIYHSRYIARVPFALATFSDGRLYEQAALDLVANPPLGTQPFYLQGAYAYLMALPMFIRPWPAFALLFQLLIAALALWGFCKLAPRLVGLRAGAWASILVLAQPMLAFYENKFLTAAPTVAAEIAILASWWGWRRHKSPWAIALLGLTTAVGILLRPNLALAVPFVIVALFVDAGALTKTKRVLVFALGMTLGLAPMAVRNGVVTGQWTVLPAHGGGTSFYIGNNRTSRGVWNDAGGLISGDVKHEKRELAHRLGVKVDEEAQGEAALAHAIGRALYAKAWAEISEAPARWVRLELRKAWLLVGNDELSQDYDVHGERALTGFDPRFGVPFGALVLLAGIGSLSFYRRERGNDRGLRWLLGGLLFATVAANLVFFTSAQHRLPLVVPLSLLAGVGVQTSLRWLREVRAQRRWRRLVAPAVVLALAGVAVGWPRTRARGPSAVHHYNLALAYLTIDAPRQALSELDRALQLRPEHPVLLIERASLRRRLGIEELAEADLRALQKLPNVPVWVQARADSERSQMRLAPP